ncbi:MAG: decaprenyl-phosphate phosphoribosyltransferase [Clostridia bacterium]|nr:decaprenyl-phosphate phosphoribosyltransferase [Clostridia bacterium]
MEKTKNILKLIRVKHYLKNVLVFLPLFFSGNVFSGKLFIVLIAFCVFCVFSSAIYILNDLCDYEKDKLHPKKKNRPIASGAISKKEAVIVLTVCLLTGTALSFAAPIPPLCILYPLTYFVLNLAYSLKLKHIPIVDIALLSSGFFIRVLYGGAVIGVTVSSWLYLTVSSIAFFMVLGKRKKELERHSDGETRAVLKEYTPDFLDKFMNTCMTLAIVFYSLWVRDLENNIMIWTVPLVIIIAMKYSLDIHKPESDGDPIDVIVGDAVLMTMLAAYAIITAAVLYLPKL